MLLVLGSLVLMLAADRALFWWWYADEYTDGLALVPGADISPNKNFIRHLPHPKLGFIYLPDIRVKTRARSWWTGQETPYELRTNSLGLRNPPVKVAKPPGTLRVVAMGGSSTMGTGVKIRQTYVHQLGKLLHVALPGETIEAINAGVDSYESYHMAVLYQQVVWDLRPDLLIIAVDVNERDKNYSVEEMARWTPPPADQWEPVPARSDAAQVLGGADADLGAAWWIGPTIRRSGLFMTLTYLSFYLGPRPNLQDDLNDLTEQWRPEQPGNPRCPARRKLGAVSAPWKAGVAAYRKNLTLLESMLRKDGVPTIYLSVPVADYDLRDINSAQPFAGIMAGLAAGRRGAVHVTAVDRFCKHGIGDVMLDDVHPTALGHSLLARALAPEATRLLRARQAAGDR